MYLAAIEVKAEEDKKEQNDHIKHIMEHHYLH